MRGEGVRVERNREGRERRGGEEDKGNVWMKKWKMAHIRQWCLEFLHDIMNALIYVHWSKWRSNTPGATGAIYIRTYIQCTYSAFDEISAITQLVHDEFCHIKTCKQRPHCHTSTTFPETFEPYIRVPIQPTALLLSNFLWCCFPFHQGSNGPRHLSCPTAPSR